MKHIKLFLILFLFISCSSEDSSPLVPPAVSKPVKPATNYVLNVSATEGGAVNNSGGEFAAGSSVGIV